MIHIMLRTITIYQYNSILIYQKTDFEVGMTTCHAIFSEMIIISALAV